MSIWLNWKAQVSCMPWRQWRKQWCWIVTRYMMEKWIPFSEGKPKKIEIYFISLIDNVQLYTGSQSMHRKGNHFPSGSSFPPHSLRLLSGRCLSLYHDSSCVSLLKPSFVSPDIYTCLSDYRLLPRWRVVCTAWQTTHEIFVRGISKVPSLSPICVPQDPLVRSKYQCGAITI